MYQRIDFSAWDISPRDVIQRVAVPHVVHTAAVHVVHVADAAPMAPTVCFSNVAAAAVVVVIALWAHSPPPPPSDRCRPQNLTDLFLAVAAHVGLPLPIPEDGGALARRPTIFFAQ